MAASEAGYSRKPLAAKLGVPEEGPLIIVSPPPQYLPLLGPAVASRAQVTQKVVEEKSRFIQFFTTEYGELVNQFPALKDCLVHDGQLWVCWPKQKSKIPTDLNENIAREVGLENGLVDVKVATIDQDWSALKFVYRLKDRPGKKA